MRKGYQSSHLGILEKFAARAVNRARARRIHSGIPAMTETKKQSMASEIKASIQAEIESGALPPGAALDERTLAERFGVSRTPVREALQQLAVQNLVKIAPRVGVFVSRLTIPQLRETLELLAELEAIAAKLAARRMDDTQRARFKELAQACVHASESNDGKEFARANMAFHELIYQASHNEFLGEQLKSLRRLMQRYRPRIFGTPAQRQRVLEEHQRLVEAILSGDEAAAQDAMLHHAPVGTSGFSEFLSMLPASYLENETIPATGSAPGETARSGSRRGRKPGSASRARQAAESS